MPQLKNLLSGFNPQFVRLLLAVLAALLLASAASYLVPSCGRRRDRQQQARATAEHAATRQQHQAATTAYRLDSTRLAERAWLLHQLDSLYRLEDAHLTRTYRPAVLPPYEQLPREGAGPAD